MVTSRAAFWLLCALTLLPATKSIGEIEELVEIFEARFQAERNKTDRQVETLTNKLSTLQTQIDKLSKQSTIENRFRVPKNCMEMKNPTGVYYIQPSMENFEVLCNMDTRGGGWTYILNRFDGSQDFSLNWESYKRGFGSLTKEFWLGLDRLHQLTNYEDNEVLIELVDWDNKRVYALYDNFKVGGELEGYPITALGKYSGNAGDSFHNHTDMKFSTIDWDQDLWFEGSCPNAYGGGWWYNRCAEVLLTGPYFEGGGTKSGGIIWKEFRGYEYSLKEARMMIRPRRYSEFNFPNS